MADCLGWGERRLGLVAKLGLGKFLGAILTAYFAASLQLPLSLSLCTFTAQRHRVFTCLLMFFALTIVFPMFSCDFSLALFNGTRLKRHLEGHYLGFLERAKRRLRCVCPMRHLHRLGMWCSHESSSNHEQVAEVSHCRTISTKHDSSESGSSFGFFSADTSSRESS